MYFSFDLVYILSQFTQRSNGQWQVFEISKAQVTGTFWLTDNSPQSQKSIFLHHMSK